jgi:hypothetical protein
MGGSRATGGITATGGVRATGGTTQTGGNNPTGGNRDSGGTSLAGGTNGGIGATGGMSLVNATTAVTNASGGLGGFGSGGTWTSGGASAVSTSTCVGADYGGLCWFLGAPGSSCDQACVTHGRTASAAAASYVGTGSQGGHLKDCESLLGLLGVTGKPTTGSRSDGLGLGCHIWGAMAYWLTTPAYSASASSASAQRVCGCSP